MSEHLGNSDGFHGAALSHLIHEGHHGDVAALFNGLFHKEAHDSEKARDIQRDVRFEAEHLRDAVHDNEVAIEKTAQATEIAVEKTGAAAILAVEKTAAAGQLFAAQNTADIRRDLAECCCEIKELVREEGTRTRELVNSLELSRVRDALADAKNELLAVRLGGGGGRVLNA